MAERQDIVIVGAGEVGYHLASILSRDGHSVSVVDPDPAKARHMNETLDVQALVGDGTRADTLTQAGATKADLLVAVTSDDHVNMLTCRLGKELGAQRCILRLKETRQLEGYRYFYKQALGYDVVLSTDELATEEILKTVREQHALEVESFCDGRVQLRRLRMPNCELVGEELGSLRLPGNVLVAAIQRGKEFWVPRGEDNLQAGDQIYLLGKAHDLDLFERMAGEAAVWRRSVVIMGASGIGRELAQRLAAIYGVTIKVIERDLKRARSLDQMGGQVLVLHGDATDVELLQEERVGEANVFIATTGDDEDNLVACQMAKALGVERTIAMVSKASYARAFDLMNLDQAISPRLLCANRILRFVRSGSPHAIAVVGEGRAEVLELTVGLREPVKLRNLDLPRGAVVGARVRGDAVLVPQGDDTLEAGDRAIVFTLPDALEAVERILAGGR